MPTHHPKIMISKDNVMNYEEIDFLIQKIFLKVQEGNNMEVVKILKEIVKEFKSENSIFEKLD